MKASSDPPKVRSLAAKSTTDGLTKKQRERQKRLEQHKAQQPQQPQKLISLPQKNATFDVEQIFSEEKREVRFAKGLGIKKIQLNRMTNSIEFELEEEFATVLRTICTWKQIEPEKYLSQLLMEYMISVQEKRKLN